MVRAAVAAITSGVVVLTTKTETGSTLGHPSLDDYGMSIKQGKFSARSRAIR